MTQQATDARPELGPIDVSSLGRTDLAALPGSALVCALAEAVDPLRSPVDSQSGFSNRAPGGFQKKPRG